MLPDLVLHEVVDVVRVVLFVLAAVVSVLPVRLGGRLHRFQVVLRFVHDSELLPVVPAGLDSLHKGSSPLVEDKHDKQHGEEGLVVLLEESDVQQRHVGVQAVEKEQLVSNGIVVVLVEPDVVLVNAPNRELLEDHAQDVEDETVEEWHGLDEVLLDLGGDHRGVNILDVVVGLAFEEDDGASCEADHDDADGVVDERNPPLLADRDLQFEVDFWLVVVLELADADPLVVLQDVLWSVHVPLEEELFLDALPSFDQQSSPNSQNHANPGVGHHIQSPVGEAVRRAIIHLKREDDDSEDGWHDEERLVCEHESEEEGVLLAVVLLDDVQRLGILFPPAGQDAKGELAVVLRETVVDLFVLADPVQRVVVFDDAHGSVVLKVDLLGEVLLDADVSLAGVELGEVVLHEDVVGDSDVGHIQVAVNTQVAGYFVDSLDVEPDGNVDVVLLRVLESVDDSLLAEVVDVSLLDYDEVVLVSVEVHVIELALDELALLVSRVGLLGHYHIVCLEAFH